MYLYIKLKAAEVFFSKINSLIIFKVDLCILLVLLYIPSVYWNEQHIFHYMSYTYTN